MSNSHRNAAVVADDDSAGYVVDHSRVVRRAVGRGFQKTAVADVKGDDGAVAADGESFVAADTQHKKDEEEEEDSHFHLSQGSDQQDNWEGKREHH